MKKSGFTLVELIGVIALLAVLSLLIVPAISRVVKKNKQSIYDKELQITLKAAQQYVTDNTDTLEIPETGLIIKTSDLYDKKYISKPTINNAVTKQDEEKCILVKWSDDLNKYEYSYTDKCSTRKYKTLEYIETTGYQHVDTGVVVKSTYDVEATYEFTELVMNQTLFCSRLDYSVSTFTLFYIQGGTYRFDYNKEQRRIEPGPTKNIKYTLKTVTDSGKKNYYIDGNLISTFDVPDFTNANLYLFASYGTPQYTNLANYSKLKIYSFKLKDGDNLLLDLIPVITEDNVICLYDKVNDQYLYNSGSKDFKAGPEI